MEGQRTHTSTHTYISCIVFVARHREEEGEDDTNIRMILYLQLTSLRLLFEAISKDLGIPIAAASDKDDEHGEEEEEQLASPTVSTYLAVFGLRTWQRVPPRRVEKLLLEQGKAKEEAGATAGGIFSLTLSNTATENAPALTTPHRHNVHRQQPDLQHKHGLRALKTPRHRVVRVGHLGQHQRPQSPRQSRQRARRSGRRLDVIPHVARVELASVVHGYRSHY